MQCTHNELSAKLFTLYEVHIAKLLISQLLCYLCVQKFFDLAHFEGRTVEVIKIRHHPKIKTLPYLLFKK